MYKNKKPTLLLFFIVHKVKKKFGLVHNFLIDSLLVHVLKGLSFES